MVSITKQYLSKDIRMHIDSNDLVLAILRIAADLEAIFFDKLFFERDLDPDLINRWMLGRYLNWNLKLNLIEKKYESYLRQFLSLRNKVVHSRMFSTRLLQNEKETNKTKKLLLLLCDFIDATEISYKDPNHEMERKYQNWLKKGE